MIRQLKEHDRKRVLDYLSEEAAINLFIIGDIEVFGFDKDFQNVWGQFDDKNCLEGVLLRFNENFIPYWKDDTFDETAFKEIIGKTEGDIIISGKESIANRFMTLLPTHEPKSMYFCELVDGRNLQQVDENIKIATTSDAQRVCQLLATIEEFADIVNTPDRLIHKIKTKTGRIYYVENDKGEIISVSQTAAENSKSAMIGGVATKKGYREQGLMTKCLTKLCYDLLTENKTLCLFYDNPDAGKVYLKLGFKPIDNWMMLSKKKSDK